MRDEKLETRRSYRGKAAEDRSAERREKLIAAGLELFGTHGYAATSVKSVCNEAGLTERYFYESFENREALFMTVAGLAAAGLMESIVEARGKAARAPEAQTDAVIRAMFGWFRADPRRARVQLLEPHLMGPTMSRMYRDVTSAFTALLKETILEWFADAVTELGLDLHLLCSAIVGGAVELVKEWVLGGFEQPLEEMVRNTEFLVGTLTAGLARHAPPRERRTTSDLEESPRTALAKLSSPGARRR